MYELRIESECTVLRDKNEQLKYDESVVKQSLVNWKDLFSVNHGYLGTVVHWGKSSVVIPWMENTESHWDFSFVRGSS